MANARTPQEPKTVPGRTIVATECNRGEEAPPFTRFAIDRTGEAVFWMDADGRLFYVNDAACRSLRYTREELLSMAVRDIDPDYQPYVWLETWRAIKECGSYTFESRHRTKEGWTFPVEITGNYVEFDGREYNCAFARDITQRKRAEEALRASEQRYRKVFDEGPLGMAIVGLDFRLVEANARLCEMLGYTREELTGLAFPELTHQDDIDMDVQLAQQLFSEEIPLYHIQKRFIKKNGEILWGALTASVIRDAAGEPLHGLGMVEDITEQKRAEEALRESEAKYRDLVETSQDLIWKCDQEGRFTYLNPAWERTHGYKLGEMLGHRFTEFETPEVVAPDLREFARLLAGGSAVGYETTHVSKSGEEIHLVFNAIPLFGGDGNIVGIQGTAYDVTERKRAAEALRESEEEFRLVFENAKDAIFWADPETGLITKCNRAAETLLEKKGDEIIGDHQTALHPREKAEYYAEMFKKHVEQQEPIDDEAEVVTKSGRIVPVHITASVTSVGGKPIIQGIFRDITERKRAAEGLRESEEKYRELTEFLPATVFEVDETGRLTFVNRTGMESFGYSKGDLDKGLDAMQVLVPEDRERVAQMLQRTLNGETFGGVEYTALRKDGSTFPVVIHGAPVVRGNRSVGIRGVVFDLTKRKRAEKALQKAREELEGRVEHQMLRRNPYGLTFRELTILHLVAAGRADKEIASELGISCLTASKHVHNILCKMNAGSRTEAGVRALREGLLE